MLQYMVMYTSKTGNTKQVAKEIFAALPGMSKDICDLEEKTGVKEADTYFVGFGVNCGTCDIDVMDALTSLHGKNIVLFGTCGMGSSEAYYQKIEHSIQAFVQDDCDYLGAFLCQGKMPMQVRCKYEDIMHQGIEPNTVKRMISNFDEALLHPDEEDMKHVREFVGCILEKLSQCQEIK